MKLTKDIEISIELLNFLKDKKSFTRVCDLAPHLNTTFDYLELIVGRLNKSNNIIMVKKGPGGGVMRFSEKPVSISDIMFALGRTMKYNKDSQNGKILEKVELLLQNETC